ncbi:MAG: hypothetical protein ACI8XO_001094 [Verrucomicrobiales bacterium]|jgi:hypothetical protein
MTQERAEASYAESYFGDDKSDYDVIKSFGAITDGNHAAHSRLWAETTSGLDDDADYFRVQGMSLEGTRNPAFGRLLDVDNLIDYMIITYHTGDRDGPGSRFTGSNPNNFYTISNRNQPDGFKYFEHDSEHSMGTGDNDMTFPFVSSSGETQFNPHWLHKQIVSNDTYRRRFADAVQRHLFNGGQLTAEVGLARMETRTAQMDKAIIAESARWGDSRRGTPFTRNDWLGAVNGVRSWINGRNNTLIGQLRARGWFPDIDAPSLNRHGGEIASSFNVLFAAPSGTVYFTTDGSDPQNPNGSIAAGAQVADPAGTQVTVLLDQGAAVRALVPTGGALGDSWQERGFDNTGWQSGTTGVGYDNNADYIPLIGTDVGAAMEGTNGTVYIRVPFNVADPDAFTSLTLRMKYDDGFVAYLNGTQVTAANAPGSPPWNGTALGNHDDALAQQFIDFDISVHLGVLEAGSNVLAIHGLNTDTGSSDMLIVPRLEGGVQSGGTAVNLLAGIQTVRTRARQAGEWSALTEARFLVDTEAAGGSNLVVSKLMYHAATPSAGEIATGFDQSGDFDYIEFLNLGALPVDLSGVVISDGIEFTFAEGTLVQPGERILMVEDLAAFEFRYGAGLPVAGQFAGGNLDNGGEPVAVDDAGGLTFIEFEYDDLGPWPVAADGQGFALMLDLPGALPDPALPESWVTSASIGGNPGSEDVGFTLAAWRVTNFTPAELADPLISGNDADPDGDRLNNFGEFALVSDPHNASQRGDLQVRFVGGFVELSFRRVVSSELFSTDPEYSTDLVTWIDTTPPIESVSSVTDVPSSTVETYRVDLPVDKIFELFFRVKVSVP